MEEQMYYCFVCLVKWPVVVVVVYAKDVGGHRNIRSAPLDLLLFHQHQWW